MSRFKIIALGLLLAFAVGCDKPTETAKDPIMPATPTTPTTPSYLEEGTKPPTPEERIVRLFKIEHVSSMGHNQIDSMVVSENQKWAYFVSNDHKNLTAFHIESPKDLEANLTDDKKWHAIDFDTKFADDAPGRANLAKSSVVMHHDATHKGALISVRGDDAHRGVALLEGAKHVAAWKNDTMANYFGVAMSKKTGEQYVSIFASPTDPAYVGNTNNVNIKKLTNLTDAQVSLDLLVERETNAFSSLPFSAQGYLVDNTGIVHVLDAQVGASVKFAALDAKNPDLGSDAWRFLSAPEVANNAVSSVAWVGNKLFIGLNSDGKQHTGGIAVYDPAAEAGKRVIRPHDDWAKSSVVALAPDNHGTVWAVTPNALIEVKLSKKSVKQGQKIDADEIVRSVITGEHDKDKTPGFKFNKTMALETLTGAHWIGDHLIMTSKNGIHVWLFELKSSKN